MPRSDPSARPISRPPVVTLIALMACGLVFLRLATLDQDGTWEQLGHYGYLPAAEVIAGRYWALFTSVFFHLDLWHVAFNAYWLWLLGSRLERTIGPFAYAAFFAAAGILSSAWQLALSDDTGIGASGVVYAMFGFMWIARRRFPVFAEILSGRTIQLFLIWMIACIALSATGQWQVGNAAHVSGLAFGALAGTAALSPRLKLPALAAAAVALAISCVPLFWAPWSRAWQGHRAYEAHAGGGYANALEHYSRLLELDPDNVWALYNRSVVHDELGEDDQADADYARAIAIDPSYRDGE